MSKLPISLDVLLLLLLVPAHTALHGAYSFLLVVPLLLYIALELALPLRAPAVTKGRIDRARLGFLARLFLLLLIIVTAVVVPTLENVLLRWQAEAGLVDFDEAYTLLHDGALQAEYAVDYLLEGRNPYRESYEETLLRHYQIAETEENPAIEHLVYLPGLILFTTPWRWALLQTTGLYDQRLLYLVLYLLATLVLPALASAPERKLSLMAGVGLNPLLTEGVLIGMNDIVILFLVVLAALFLLRRRWLLAAGALALACAMKQTAWLLMPFFLFPFFGAPRQWRQALRGLGGRVLVVLALVGGILIIPFVLWDGPAFMEDVFAYPAGRTELVYPIRGYTLGRLLVGLGAISSPLAPFPFWITQLAFGMPLLWLLLRYQSREASLARLFIAAGFFVFAFGFFSRFFQENYVGLATALITLGVLVPDIPVFSGLIGNAQESV